MGKGLKRAVGAAMQSRLPVKVKAGQVWRDNDQRMGPREIKVLAIEGDRAIVQRVSGVGTKTKIRLDRFRPTTTGYRLVQD